MKWRVARRIIGNSHRMSTLQHNWSRRISVPFLGILLIVAVSVGLGWAVARLTNPSPARYSPPPTVSTPEPQRIYHSTATGLTFRYPPSWVFKQTLEDEDHLRLLRGATIDMTFRDKSPSEKLESWWTDHFGVGSYELFTLSGRPALRDLGAGLGGWLSYYVVHIDFGCRVLSVSAEYPIAQPELLSEIRLVLDSIQLGTQRDCS